jgi:hypothetical protein
MVRAKVVVTKAVISCLVLGYLALAGIAPRRLTDWTPCAGRAGQWCTWAGLPSHTADSCTLCADWSLPFLGVPSVDPHKGAVRIILLVYVLFGVPLIAATVVLVWRGKAPSLRFARKALATVALVLLCVVLGKMSASYMASWVVCAPSWPLCNWLGLCCHRPEDGAAADIFGQLALFAVPVLAGIVALIWWGGRLERRQVIRGATALAAALGFLAVGMYGSAYLGLNFVPTNSWGLRGQMPSPDLAIGLFLGYILYAAMIAPFFVSALLFPSHSGATTRPSATGSGPTR